MSETELRERVRERLAMIAAPHQHPRDVQTIATFVGFRSEEEHRLLLRIIREEAGRLHILVL